MHKLWAVFKNEIIRYFISPLAYVYLLCFLILNGSFAIYFGDFFNRGQADLWAMFTFQPWLYLLFIPGISARLWAEEFRSKTIIQLVTMPVTINTLVLGKFLAAWCFCTIALILTFPFWISVNLLGSPDNPVIALSYAASFILAGCMLAVAQTLSALTKSQVIAMILGVIVNLLFFWSGIEYVLSFFRTFLPDTLIDVIASFSFLSHFSDMCHGIVEMRDILYFGLLICFSIYTTDLIISCKTSGNTSLLKTNTKADILLAWLALLISFCGINILANNFTRNYAFDATQEKTFTLTASTKEILRALPEQVTAKLYFTPLLEQRNSALRKQFDTIRLLLQKYKNAAAGNFDYKIYYPQFLSAEEDLALADGIQPIPLVDLNQNALFGMTLEDTLQNKNVIPFFANSEQGMLEQDITTKIYQLHHHKKNLGIITSTPLFGSMADDTTFLGDPWAFINLLAENYNIHKITNPQDFEDFPFDALLIFYPENLSAEMLRQIKRYGEHNGKIVLILDPAAESSRLYDIAKEKLHPSNAAALEQMFNFKIYNDFVVADLQNSLTVDATVDYAKNPVFTQDLIQFKVPHENLNPHHPITQNLHELLLASAAIITPDKVAYSNKSIKFYPLLKAGEISSLMPSSVVIDGLNPQEILKYFEPDNNQKILAAEIVSQDKNNPYDVVVVGDSDFLYDSFWLEKTQMLESTYFSSAFDNANFILNTIDYLTGDTVLLPLRGKKTHARRFSQIETLRRLNSLEYQRQQEQIFNLIDRAKRSIQEIWSKKDFEERENFTADELAALAKVRQNLNTYRQQLSNLRYQAYKNIARIDRKLTIFNIWLIPAIFGLCFLAVFLYNMFKKRQFLQRLHFQRKVLYLCALSIVLLGSGFAAVYWTNRSTIDTYAGKLAFPQILPNINRINTIKLQNNRQTLTFNKQDNLWTLQEYPDFPVYQERIRRLLTTLAEAKFFARKSNRAENLAMFKLDPLEAPNSQTLKITLSENDDVIQTFYLGDINIDIGRGGKAAYIRFEDQFQVWEINADFISMDLNRQNWTYANLWDLRYGRLQAPDNDDQKRLANLLKLLLNTKVLGITPLPNAKAQQKISMQTEEGNRVTITFYSAEKQSYAAYDFSLSAQNPHLELLASYMQDKAYIIDNSEMEKIIEIYNH